MTSNQLMAVVEPAQKEKDSKPSPERPVAVPDRHQLHLVSAAATLEEGGPPRASFYTIFAVVLLTFSVIAWAASTKVTNSTIVLGTVTPTGAVIEVQHYEGGIVEQVPVHEGDIVEAGDRLLMLDPTADNADLQQMRARHAALNIEMLRLRAQALNREPDFGQYIHSHPDLTMHQIDIIDSGRASLASESAVLQSRLAQRQSEIEMYRGRVENLEQQRAVVGEQLRMRQTLLERGLASRLTVLDVQREYTRLDGELAQAHSNLAGAEQAAEEARRSEAELRQRFRSDAVASIGTIAAELAEVTEQLTRLEDRVARREVLAPIRGVVSSLSVSTPGQVIEPGQSIASLVPTEGGVVIEAQMEPADVGHVAVGQSAEVTIDGFDAAAFGTLSGTVVYVSATTFTNQDGLTYYDVRIEPSGQGITHQGIVHPLVPGMISQVSIQTGEQSMLSYLVRPVYNSLSESFSER